VNSLSSLSLDASNGDKATSQHTADCISMVSIEALSACSRACLALSESEVLVARACSLLNKFPQQFQLVEKIISQPDGTPIEVTDKDTQSIVLQSLQEHQFQARKKGRRRQKVEMRKSRLMVTTN